jgi:hypothetical protein
MVLVVFVPAFFWRKKLIITVKINKKNKNKTTRYITERGRERERERERERVTEPLP